MEMVEKKCIPNTTKLPNKILSAIKFSTYLQPTNTTTKHSYNEHPPDYCHAVIAASTDNRRNSSNVFYKKHKSWSFPYQLSSLNYSKNKKQKMIEKNINKYPETATQNCKIKTTTLSSATSPVFKNSNRKYKCNRTAHTTVTTVLQQIKTIHSSAKNIALPAARKTKSEFRRTKTTMTTRTKFLLLPNFGTTSFFTLLTLLCLETVLLSTVSNCAKTFYMHWNTSNSIFRIDNTDHIIDVNKGNLAFEFDQVHIICPVYEPGTFENETEKYIIYNVSKVEYETCRITNADPRVIAICDKPQKLMFFTITFRPFTPQPGGLEFLPGNDYYFISTSSKDDLYRRIGGRCSTNNMKVVFKVCCSPEEKNKTNISSSSGSSIANIGGDSSADVGDTINTDINIPPNVNKQQHMNTIGINGVNTGLIPGQLKPLNGPSGTSINTNIDQFNRIPMQTSGNVIGNNNVGSGIGLGGHGGNGIMLTPGHVGINMIPTGGVSGVGGQYPGLHSGQTGIRINNVPSTQHYPSHKNNNNNDDHYDKHPNEVVKNEELTYNSAAPALNQRCSWKWINTLTASYLESIISTFLATECSRYNRVSKNFITTEYEKQILILNKFININYKILNVNPIILLSMLLIFVTHCIFKYSLSSSSYTERVQIFESAKSSYLPVKRSYSRKMYTKVSKPVNTLR